MLTKLNLTCRVLLIAASFACALPALGFTGKIALTFDDAPTPDSALLTGTERTQKIVATLQANKVKDALIFVKAENLNEATLNRLKHYTNAGMHLANHSFSHQSANELTTNDFLTDAYRAHLLLKDLDNFLPYFRPPYLHYGKDLNSIMQIQKNIAQLNYQDGFVTIDNADWYINSILVKAAQEGKKIDLKKSPRFVRAGYLGGDCIF
jgi:peptidoglycan-N-acetylglucosamine deacetylase